MDSDKDAEIILNSKNYYYYDYYIVTDVFLS